MDRFDYTKTIPEEYYTHHNPDRQNHNQSSELIRFDILCSHVTHCEVLIYKIIKIGYKNVNGEHVCNILRQLLFDDH